MGRDPQYIPPLFTHVDVSASSSPKSTNDDGDVVSLLREMLVAQDRQNQLLEELVNNMHATQKQRANELGQWKQANPALSRNCREAAEALSQAQTQYLDNLTEEIKDNSDCLTESDFMLNELVDRYGPRLAHLNGVLQVLSQLSNMPNETNVAD